MSTINCQLSTLKRLFDSNALWLSMILGALCYRWLLPLAPLLPWLIFFMLFFTFCKVNPRHLRLHRWHWVVLATQLTLSFVSYFAVLRLTHNPLLAQGLLMCFIMPTATAAPIIAGKLGGSIQNLTTFTLLSNFATALLVPATFPLINPAADMSFWSAFFLILKRVAPLLLGPFILAWLVRIIYNAYYRHHNQSVSPKTFNCQLSTVNCQRGGLSGEAGLKKEFVLPQSWAQAPFYLWVASIVILASVVTKTVLENIHYSLFIILWLLFGSLIAALTQFGLGKLIGYYLPAPDKGHDYQDVLINPAAAPTTMAGVSSITAGQAFGQKNTSLGVWMAQTYLNPMAAIGAAAYIIWQNLFNSLQLTIAAHKKS